jgi:hypothetical protein
LKDLSRVLLLLKEAGVSLKREKCSFTAQKVRYLGLNISNHCVQVDEEKTAAVRKAMAPTIKSELRRFLRMTGLYRKFIPSYAEVSAPLTKYLQGDRIESFDLDPDAMKAHENQKMAITSTTVLAFPNKDGSYVLETDASAAQLEVYFL